MNTPGTPSYYNVQNDENLAEIQRGFIMRVYGWMTFGLFLTACVALITTATPGLLMAILATPILFYGMIIAEFILVVVLSSAVNRMSPGMAGFLFIGYAFLNGVTLSVITVVYSPVTIALAFGITACTFGIMTLFGYTTDHDLTKIGSLLIMALFGMILASLVNLFLATPLLYWVITYVSLVIFIGLIAYDTQKLKRMSLSMDVNGQVAQKASVLGALMLYLDFINILLLLLRILSGRGGRIRR
jgi:uncharacterized protein